VFSYWNQCQSSDSIFILPQPSRTVCGTEKELASPPLCLIARHWHQCCHVSNHLLLTDYNGFLYTGCSVLADKSNDVTTGAGGCSKKPAKSKRVRTIFTQEQLERLEAEFERQQYMVGPERLYLAHALQLTEAQVRLCHETCALESELPLEVNFIHTPFVTHVQKLRKFISWRLLQPITTTNRITVDLYFKGYRDYF
jgi:hypothetical protein